MSIIVVKLSEQPCQPAENIEQSGELHPDRRCRQQGKQNRRRRCQPGMGFFDRFMLDSFFFTILPRFAVFRAVDCQLITIFVTIFERITPDGSHAVGNDD